MRLRENAYLRAMEDALKSGSLFHQEVRLISLDPPGEDRSSDTVTLEYFDGILPQVGDVIATLWPEDDDYDACEVVSRARIHEHGDVHYWALLVRRVAHNPQDAAIFRSCIEQSAKWDRMRRERVEEGLKRLAEAKTSKRRSRKTKPKPQ